MALAVAAAALGAATCQQPRASAPVKPTTASPPAPTSTPAGASSERTGQARAATSQPPPPPPKWDHLSPAAKRELDSVLSDEFCYCGCPHSLGACLKIHSTCQHARRMAEIAASEAEAGAPSVEISVTLSKYYLSFRERRRTFPLDSRLCQGPADAQVTLIEFSDFECPYCAVARPILEKFAQEHSSQVRFCYAPFPLPNHPNAQIAGQAALFARDHSKFWAMHDLLFENQARLSRDSIRELAGRLGLNAAQLTQAWESGQYADELQASRAAGVSASVESTPTLYINGRRLTLSLTEKNLNRSVEDEIEWSTHSNRWAAD